VKARELEASARAYQDLYNTFLNRYNASLQQAVSPVAGASVITPATPLVQKDYKKTYKVAGIDHASLKAAFVIVDLEGTANNPAILVEREIGDIGTGYEIHEAAPDLSKGLTSPAQARQFVESTGIDTVRRSGSHRIGEVVERRPPIAHLMTDERDRTERRRPCRPRGGAGSERLAHSRCGPSGHRTLSSLVFLRSSGRHESIGFGLLIGSAGTPQFGWNEPAAPGDASAGARSGAGELLLEKPIGPDAL
jgi:hypothetical protein